MFLSKKNIGLGILFLVLMAGCSPYESLNNLNFEYRYNAEMPLQAGARVVGLPRMYRIYLEMEDKKIPASYLSGAISDKYYILYRITSGYGSRDFLAGDTVSNMVLSRSPQGIFYATFDIEQPAVAGAGSVILLDISEKNGLNSYFIDLPLENQFLYATWSEFSFFKRVHKKMLPIISSYISLKDTIVLSAHQSGIGTFFIRQYEDNFMAALPPMAMSGTSGRPLSLLSQAKLETGRLLAFGAPGLYFIQADTAAGNAGISILVTENRYPQTVKADLLIEPLIYITTRDERARMSRAKNQKEALDRFWLEIGGSREQARKLIRTYYEQVEYANAYFTSFKPGWKTDRGMIYIIFGKPDKVVKLANKEEWHYQKNANAGDIFFTFIKKPTIFTPDNYELVRYNEYDRIWYNTVEQWRKGILRK